MCLYQTPGRRLPRITGRFVNTVTRGRVGAPNDRAPFNFHGAYVGFVHQCRGLGISPLPISIWLSFSQADLGQHLPRKYFFCFLFESLELFFPEDFVLIASGTEILWRVSLKVIFFWQHRVFIVIGLSLLCERALV